MEITLQYLGQLGPLAGKDQETVCAKEGLGTAELIADATRDYGPEFAAIVWDGQNSFRPSLMILVNDQAVDKQNPPILRDRDRVLLLPAIAGG